MEHDMILMHLNRLIKIAEDGKDGYRSSADMVEVPQYRKMFLEIAQQRGRFAEQLRAEVTKLGGEPADSGSFAGPIHRAWVNLRVALSSKNVYPILDECRRGDESAVEEYQEILKAGIPTPIAQLLGDQVRTINETLGEIKSLADARA